MATLRVALAAGATLATYGAWKTFMYLISPFFSSLRYLPGPKSKGYLLGNLVEVGSADNSWVLEEWMEQYGKVIKYKGLLGENQLVIMDTRALNHILTHSADYQKHAESRYLLSRLLGDGVLVTEGEKHRQQRRIMNPSFGPSPIKDLTPIFFQKALQLRDIWKSSFTEESDAQRIEVLSWLSRATLDVIGLAGFGYKLDALNTNQEPNELNKAFSTLFNMNVNFGIIDTLRVMFPIFRIIPTKRDREERRALASMKRIGESLLRQRKRAALGELDASKEDDTDSNSELAGRDLLSALVRANMDTELPDAQRMVDEDVLAQVPTFIVAGHETTSAETMWCLFALAQEPAMQARLRAELLAVPSDTPSADDLNALPFLDAVVRETLRLHAAVFATSRVAMRDDVIPLAEPFVDTRGQKHTELRVDKGAGIVIPILAINRSKEIYGADADKFNPDRWTNLPEASKHVPGVWGNTMAFLGGARSCIGFRFALFEMKALLFTLLRTFEFELALPAEDFERRTFLVTQPYIKGQKDAGPQMPLNVRLHHANDA